jgi:murein DD-endopeptidase MepM/ murein hydrolase activator NlpD
MKINLRSHLPVPSPRRLKWLAIASALPFFGVVTAFGIAPDTHVHAIQQTTRIEAVALTTAAATAKDAAWDYWIEERIHSGDTLGNLALRLGLSSEEARRLVSAAQGHPMLRNMRPGRSVLARVTHDGQLLLLRYLNTDGHLLTVERAGEAFSVKAEPAHLEARTDMRSGVIQSSLYGATDAADIPDSIASELADVFSGEIDFHRELQRGDRFSVLYETHYHDGQLVRTGRLLAAEFINNGKTHQAFAFTDPQGRQGYYTAEGKSLKRAFLKSPIPFSRISSGFTGNRFHPVLKTWRAHKGIDYAAPTGTPVRAVSDAVVEFSGHQGGYGNLVVLKHSGAYSTAYGHLSRFGKGIRRGTRISQGQIIGFVGMTGMTSGPHLHYEFRVGGEQRNPLTLKLPTAIPLDPRSHTAFKQSSEPLVAQLGMIRDHNLAAFE